jgi:hypothetical protein
LDVITTVEAKLKDHKPAEIIDTLVKKIKYKKYLIKEEGNESAANEKYENIGQIINMAGKYEETGEEALR